MPRRRSDRGPWFWRGMIALMLGIVFVLFAVVAFNRPPAVMADTGCRTDRNDPAHTIILIDQSDPFNPNDLDWVYEFVDAEARGLPKYGRLTVMTPNAESPYDPKVIHLACSPGGAAEANPIFQNPNMIEQTWQTQFYAPLLQKVEATLLDTRQPSSPLAEAIYSIADRADFQAGDSDRRVVLVSDLMQHSDAFSFYRTGADYEVFLSSELAETIPQLDDVEVVARIVPRQIYDLPVSDVKSFWRAYFDETDAEYGSVN